jgi:hypothetical protein
MGGVRITIKDSQILLGRVINSDETSLLLMIVGNQTVTIRRDEIEKMENEKKITYVSGTRCGDARRPGKCAVGLYG